MKKIIADLTVFSLMIPLALLACSVEEPPGEPLLASGNNGGVDQADGGGGDTNVDAPSSSGAGGGPGGGAGGSGVGGTADSGTAVGTLVVLGDSISDGGGEAPFYYDVLLAELETHYGKTIAYENHAQAGTTTLFLAGQIEQLPTELEGPVAVVITSGGNNMQYNIFQILLGADQMARDNMSGHIDDALTELLVPDRFGSGVSVTVFETNVYDASDGQGDYGSNGCVMPIDAPNGSAGFFADWNTVIADQVSAHGQQLIDIHTHFAGHGFIGAPNWYAADCVHPNTFGHAEISELMLASIVSNI
jgi:lysophospholipase L1-like esterase